MSLKLFSADGKLVKHEQANAGTHSINVNGLAKGMYTLLAGTQAKRILVNN
ncbi:MAG: T9SS type A sorting domain-containing protein [Chitinophagaceae bacterium]|nr:T9SS type A sorting domain-containing protein [Chitinophagaceae bacterium]